MKPTPQFRYIIGAFVAALLFHVALMVGCEKPKPKIELEWETFTSPETRRTNVFAWVCTNCNHTGETITITVTSGGGGGYVRKKK